MRQQVRGIAQEFHEFFLTDPGSMNPFEATLTVEYEAALNAGRARAVTHEAAILVDVQHDVLRRESEHCYRCLVLLHTLEANIGLVGAVARYTVIGDPAAELARQLLDPAIGEGDFPPPRRTRRHRPRRTGNWTVKNPGCTWRLFGRGVARRRRAVTANLVRRPNFPLPLPTPWKRQYPDSKRESAHSS